MLDQLVSALLFAAQVRGRCACSDATRLHAGAFSIPVGPVTVLFAAVAVLFLPPVVLGWVARRREARAMRRVLGAEDPLAPT